MTSSPECLADSDEEVLTRHTKITAATCSRCWSEDIAIGWCDGCRKRSYGSICNHRDPEHLHMTCRQCGYEWTEQTMNEDKIRCDDQ